jgi:hypothetical protein
MIRFKIIRFTTLIMMKYMLSRVKKKHETCDNDIVQHAYRNIIKNYEDTILYLNAMRKY